MTPQEAITLFLVVPGIIIGAAIAAIAFTFFTGWIFRYFKKDKQ